MRLFLHYFKNKNIDRCKELDFCTKHNINNKNFEKVFLLLENETDKQDWMLKEHVEIICLNKRLNFKDMFEFANTITTNQINVLCNLDIFFDDTIQYINNMKDNDFITLTRWNIDVKTKQANFFNVNCSQDTWIWKGKVDLNKLDLDFNFGVPGCDNAICGEFHINGYRVLNPSLTIKTYHLHSDTSRSYSGNDIVRKKLYLLYPTQDFESSKIVFWKDCTNFIPK